jgi:flagellar hook assembly protein FlgD
VVGPNVGINDEEFNAAGFALLDIYPNPFNSSATIQFSAGSNEVIALKIFNIRGEEIYNHSLDSFRGKNSFTWKGRDSNGSPLASGIYFVRLEMTDNFLIRKAILLK